MDRNADEYLSFEAVLRSIATAAERIAGDGDWRPAVADLLARLAPLMGAKAAYVDRCEGGGDGTFRQVELLRWPDGDGPARDAAATQAWCERHATGEIVQATLAGKAVLQAPILLGGALRGVVGIQAIAPRRWSETEVAAVSAVASVVGIALDRAGSTALMREIIDSLDASVVVYDADDRYVLGNRRYHQRYPHLPADDQLVGRSFEDMIRAGIAAGNTGESTEMLDVESWVEERMRRWRIARMGSVEIRRDADGAWTMLRNTRTADGKIVTLRYDISEQKRIERELEAARDDADAKSAMLARIRPLLSGIVADLGHLSRSDGAPDKRRRATEAGAAAERVLSMIDGLFAAKPGRT